VTRASRAKPPAPAAAVLAFLDSAYPDARVLLSYRTPFELLVATVLAAQCTDERVNRVTPGLFRTWPDARAMASAAREALEEAVRPTGFYRNKAAALKGLAKALVDRHEGKVPRTLEELTALPGVGRKTAAVILGECFGDAAALPVDTHVARVAFRLGLSASREPGKIEEDLAAAVAPERRFAFATRLGWHGRRVCAARKPRCSACGLRGVCQRRGVTASA